MSLYHKFRNFLAFHGLPMCAAAFLTTAAWIYFPVRHFCLENSGAKIGDWKVWAIVGWKWQWLLSALTVAAIITTVIPRAMARRQPEIIKLLQKINERDQDMAARQKDLDSRAADLDRREAEFFETQRNSENAKAEAEAQTQQIMVEAKKQADALIQSAQNRAAEIIKHAQAEAAKIVDDALIECREAQIQAKKIIHQAQVEAREIISDAKAQAELVVRRIGERHTDHPQTLISSSQKTVIPSTGSVQVNHAQPAEAAKPDTNEECGTGDQVSEEEQMDEMLIEDSASNNEIMEYIELIKSLRTDDEMTWRQISEFLYDNFRIKIDYANIRRLWKNLQKSGQV